ncbi:MAG TPA: PQQ-dependent sugar dehydrogenase, partial [Flavobacteriales bacterium]|nr:PQQ-dependent sugar dehydrogenase [Flavobacteriales bacterium]
MAHNTSFIDTLSGFVRPRLIVPLVVVLSFFTVAFMPELLNPDSGLQNAEPIGPYMNGVFTADPPTPGGATVTYTVQNAFPNLTFNDPVKMLELPSGKFMVFGKSGYAWVFNNDPATGTKTQVLNINNRTRIDQDGGLLGAALHPEYGQQGSPNARYFYVWYRYFPVGDPRGEQAFMRLSRFTMNAAETLADPASEFVLVQQFDRQNWHNGGDMFFGPDGFLYFAVGDEGGANDQYNRTQNISSWFFGGVFRIDVDMQGGSISHPIRRQPINGATPPSGWPNSFTQGYYIPNDNPWQDPGGGILEEFWALGTRSPHRMTYDPPTGDIWIGDVGQGSREEISRAFAGANLQWPYREGDIAGPKTKPNPLIGYDQLPVYSYPRSFGQCVIGGYVIRGNKYPELNGRYIFSDHETQNIHTLELSAFGTAQNLQFLLNVPAEGTGGKDGISSFSMASDGTLYILDLYGTNLDGGKVRKLVRIQNGVPEPPALLSQLGVFTDLATLQTAPGIIPFTVNSPLWSDRAEKRRWMAIPNDGSHDSPAERIGFNADDKWTFPPGTVMIKHFELPLNENDPGQKARLETRFMIYKNSGEAYGLTYRWNANGT